ncbi:MAG: DUF3280 domain-containing protein [Dongiaceae bacterium]
MSCLIWHHNRSSEGSDASGKRRRRQRFWAALLLISLAPWTEAAAEPVKLAVFDFELIDTSLEGEVSGPRKDEQNRLRMISDLLRTKLAESGRYSISDLSSLEDKIDGAGYRYSCNGCVTDLAAAAGAEQAITGTVQKVSNLILNINVYLWDVKTGEQTGGTSVDIRGNTDESWSRGVSYLVRNRILAQ